MSTVGIIVPEEKGLLTGVMDEGGDIHFGGGDVEVGCGANRWTVTLTPWTTLPKRRLRNAGLGGRGHRP